MIVVDDHGDRPFVLNESSPFPIQVLRLEERSGPAIARNRGASIAQGKILMFIDSDILIFPQTLQDTIDSLALDDRKVVNGMIDTTIPAQDFFSNFYNLRLCYNYQRLPEKIATIYSSMFAIKRDVFLSHGGFSPRFDRPTVEDSEFGYRLAQDGIEIQLNKQLRFIHQKKITLRQLLINDWIKSIAKAELAVAQLGWRRMRKAQEFYSTPRAHLLSVPFAMLAMVFLPFGVLRFPWFVPCALSCGAVAYLNLGYLSFFRRHRGLLFSVQGYLFLLFDLNLAGAGALVGISRRWRHAS